MAIIDNLPSLTTLASTDEFAVERGTTTYKTTYDVIVRPLNLNFTANDNTWSAIYSVLSGIEGQNSAFFLAQGAASSVLTGGKYTNALKGVINRAATGVYDFMAYTGYQPQYIWIWRISGFTSASTTPTVSAVYRFTGTAI